MKSKIILAILLLFNIEVNNCFAQVTRIPFLLCAMVIIFHPTYMFAMRNNKAFMEYVKIFKDANNNVLELNV